MSHSSHSAAQQPSQGNAGAQQQENPQVVDPSNSAAAPPSASPIAHTHQTSVQAPAAPGETENVQPEIEDEECNAPIDDLEKGLPDSGNNHSGSAVPRSDNTMNEEGVEGEMPQSRSSKAARKNEFESGSTNNTLPPIDDKKGNRSLDKAAARDLDECNQFKAMTIDQKKKALDNYNPQEQYVQGTFLDAQDTTNIFIMAQVVHASATDISVNFDGWPEKWNQAFRKRSYKIAPFRTMHQGYSGQTKVAIRPCLEPLSKSDIRVHTSTLEGYIQCDFEGKTAHQMNQYIRGHLFVFLDSLMGLTYTSSDQLSNKTQGKHPFECNEIQKLFKTFLRFVTCYLRKLTTLGKAIQELATVRNLFLVDPQAAIVSLYPEIAQTLQRLFATDPRTVKHYIMNDESQMSPADISKGVAVSGEAIMANSFGTVVADYTTVDFIGRRHQASLEYNVDEVRQRVYQKQELVFGTLLNFVQYFTEIGGFDALLSFFKTGPEVPSSEPSAVPLNVKKIDSGKSAASNAASGDPNSASVQVPFKILSSFSSAFTHLNFVFTPEFGKIFTEAVKEKILGRLDSMSESDLKYVDKDDIILLINQMRDFLGISMSRQETAQFVETTILKASLRFLKSENLEKRLKGLGDIRFMVDRVMERSRFERWRQKTGKTLNHYMAIPDNKERAQPTDTLRAADLKQWLIQNGVIQILLSSNSHIEIVKRSGSILRLLTKYGDNLFDESIVELVWKCQQGKHEEMVRTIYNLIQEVMPHLSLPIIDAFFDKIKQMPPAQIDEKYIVFLRKFSKEALKKRFEFSLNNFAKESEVLVGTDTQDKLFTNIYMAESQQLSMLTATNAGELADQLELTTFDYGLRLFWQICLQSEGSGGVSAELHELTMHALQDIFGDKYAKQVRTYYLFKAIQNILAFQSVNQSMTVATKVIQAIMFDQNEMGMYNIPEDEQNKDSAQQQQQQQPGAAVKLPVQALQDQVAILDALVNYLVKYHGEVKQKCKQIYDTQQGALPDKIDEQVFSGRYPHGQTINACLEFIEFITCMAQKYSITADITISLGIENIKRLWNLFVKEPNFASDHAVFLDWIYKQRSYSQIHIMNDQKRQFSYELFLFNDEEKRFLFTAFLCNPDEVNASSISVSLVKCFQKYFRMINSAEQNLSTSRNKIQVLKFGSLIGMDNLWKMAVLSTNEKAKELSQELLVSLHLKWDNKTATQEHKQAIIMQYIQRCMDLLTQSDQKPPAQSISDKKAITQLLSLYLDRYEGIRVLKPELSYSRLTNFKPLEIDVISFMDSDVQYYITKISLSCFKTIGHLRAKIASELGLEINQFSLSIKNTTIDPDNDDDRYIKDIQNFQSKCSIKRRTTYDPQLHPKFLLAKNQDNFNLIFSMLQANSPELCEPVWALISKLPQNVSVIESLQTLDFIKNAGGTPEATKAAWTSLLNPQAIFKLLYCLQIMQKQFLNAEMPETKDEEMYDENVDLKVAIQAYQQQSIWKKQFIDLGGFEHLLYCLIQIDLSQIKSTLELKIIRNLISVTFKFINHFHEVQQLEAHINNGVIQKLLELQSKETRSQCILKVISFIDAVCQYSIEQEELRGESVEAIQKKIEQAKLQKQRQKLRSMGNKSEKVKTSSNDEDDEDTDEKKKLMAMTKSFKEQSDIVLQLFNFVNQLCACDEDSPQVIVDYPQLSQMLVNGMILSENHFLRMCMSEKIQTILTDMHTKKAIVGANSSYETCFAKILDTMLTKLVSLSKQDKYEGRSNQFYDYLSDVLQLLELKDLQILNPQILHLISQLPIDIMERPTKEIGSADTDILLGGLINALIRLLQRFPSFKKQVGATLTHYIVHDCLFEIPHGTKSAPKCKSQKNRRNAFLLLQCLSTDCIDNLLVVLDYMERFNQKPSWRTNKENDWNIKLYEDEKSITGHVGIKNLGCICYMNSLHQQLFMIPGFRNDILSVTDPNHDKNADEDNMFMQFQTLFAGLLLSQKMYVNPKGYCHAFKDWEGQPVNVFEQMDVEEYLTMFLDRLEAAIKGTPQEKTIQYHFGGKFANEVICKDCPHFYTRSEDFLSLGVPVKNKKNFDEGMEAFITGDLLDQDNQYYCEKCDKKVDALKRTCIQDCPRYLITTLKRFDFDFDLMIRKKLNDYFEFQVQIDLHEYTQEYLNKKEKQDKDAEERKKNEADDENEELPQEIKMSKPSEYYQYDLVGVIVHAGTADSGHYYSYIKEQEVLRLEKDGSDKWYEFNDCFVRDFDSHEIPAETYGGEETAYGGNGFGNQREVMRMRNAYVLIYKRRLTDESLLVSDEVETVPESQPNSAMIDTNTEAAYKLGAANLELDSENPLNQKIQWDNHRYWHIRFLFREDYQNFVTKTLLYWNTENIIPAMVSWRNDDFHLLDPKYLRNMQEAKVPIMVEPPTDCSLDMRSQETPEKINEAKFAVFKFAIQFYYTIQQRSQQKYGLPDMSRYLKSYINEDVRCAQWFINEFINTQMLKEIMMQNCQKIMRRVYIGIVTCAMLKVFQKEKHLLNLYWDDVEAGVQNPRQTTLGNYVNTLLYMLPELKDFSANQAQFLQLISQFCRLGIEAKMYLVRADTIQRLLNYFFFKNTPFQEAFVNAPRLNFEMNEAPTMGLPTPEDPNQKLSNLAQIKENERRARLMSTKPAYTYMIETMANLIRCCRIEPEDPTLAQQATPVYQLRDLGFSLTQDNLVLFTPDVSFTAQMFSSAHKSRAAVALSKAYVHHSYYSQSGLINCFKIVLKGLDEFDFDKARPFLILFQHMLEVAQTGAPQFVQSLPEWLEIFFKHVGEQLQFYQMMEVIIDWVNKVACRLPMVRAWMAANVKQWSFLSDWLSEHKEPPQYGDKRAQVLLNKPPSMARPSQYRQTMPKRIFSLNQYRKIILHSIKQGNAPDLSNEIDIDYYHLDDYKLLKEQKVMVLEDRLMYVFYPAQIGTDLDELVYIRMLNREQQHWEATDKGRMFISGVWENSHMCKELTKIEKVWKDRMLEQRQLAEKNRQGICLEDDMDIDENNNHTLEEGVYNNEDDTPVAARQVSSGQEANEDMLDETEQDEFNAA